MTRDSLRLMQAQITAAEQELAQADELIALLQEAGEDVTEQRRRRLEVETRINRWKAALASRTPRS